MAWRFRRRVQIGNVISANFGKRTKPTRSASSLIELTEFDLDRSRRAWRRLTESRRFTKPADVIVTVAAKFHSLTILRDCPP
jgi:hypothetical protein